MNEPEPEPDDRGPTGVPVEHIERKNELFVRLGRICVCWSHLEASSSLTIWALARLEGEKTYGLAAGMQARSMWDFIEALLSFRDMTAELGIFEEWRQRAEILQRLRNKAVHAQWIFAGGAEMQAADLTSRSTKKRGAATFTDEELSYEALDKLAIDITRLSHSLDDFHMGIRTRDL